ncbi:Histidine kinase-, DNA gyrase B-, and HSP90-like ATPase [Pseudoxanthomonas sp. GM95]|uniref:sensor histidine kinase n=1 Tax=Pseudoxanthomonas sp. GM95 TaxID=1881043 RepID=UPI0008C9C5DB|nr:ATP-binding protein [Pseudoxanthomonas sp. GM95]SEM27299.1 Histidine kinase-, DNA gyrase B-, and HSP90-like ATPase [Pseudoxanthomonas sp. GM95]
MGTSHRSRLWREPWGLPLWRQAVAWLRRVPATDSIDRRNAPALQVLLIFLGTEIPLNKGYHLLTASRIQMDATQLAVDIGTDAAMTLAAWIGVWLIRRGKVKPATALFIGITLCSGIAANIAFGYQLQAFDPYPMMLLTLAALVIGRWALWAVYVCIPGMFWLGMESPEGQAPGGQGNPFQNLPSLAMSYFMITLVLDRTVEALREGLFSARRSAERLRVEMRERERVQERLLHLQKIESVGHLASGVSHDFNNILGAIIGYTAQRHRLHELDFDPVTDAQAMGEALEGVELAAQRGVAISRKLLSFSRRELAVPSDFDVAGALRELQPMLRQLFGTHVQVQLVTPPAPCVVHLDRAQFDLVMLNFAANARDAMPEGGTFTIEVSIEQAQVVLRLSDTGIGMPAEVMQQAFEPFFTTKPAGQGTGLGLAVAQELTQQSGGSLWVDSAPGQGTRFTLRLPQVAAPLTVPAG